ncbi:MAG: adenine phosphoribosyltransferase, partial [Chloroflexi bacterium]|nr:adenine phosphoribosyltransferase [Chloroflexota bacterium]
MNYLKRIDTNTSGQRYDATPLFANYAAFVAAVADLAAPFANESVDLVAGIDALGFILGTAVAAHLQKGFLAIRKKGKLPVAVHSVEFVDYSSQQKGLEIRTNAFPPGTNVLLVDEWIETGTQVKAAIELVGRMNGRIAGIATLNMDD